MPIIQAVDSTGMQLSSQVGSKGLLSLFYSSPFFQELIYKCYALCYVPAHLIPDYHNSVIADAVDEGQEQDPAWEDYFQEIEEFGMYMLNTWIERRGGRPPLFPPQVWSQYDAIMEDKVQTNNILEWFNRTWNSLVGTSSNVWTIQQACVKRDAEARRIFLINAVVGLTSTITLEGDREVWTITVE